MERKVTEWGCMQALIDYDGWRKWKDYAKQLAEQPKDEAAEKAEKKKKMAEMKAQFSRPPPRFDSNRPVDPPRTADKPPKTVDAETVKAEVNENTSAVTSGSSTPSTVSGPAYQNGGVKKPGRNLKSGSRGSTGLGPTPEVEEGR